MIKLKAHDWCLDDIETVLFDKDGTFIDLHYFWGKMTELRALEMINHFCLPEDVFLDLCLYLGYNIKTQKMLENGITALYSRSKIIELFKEDLKKHNVYTTDKIIAELFDKVSEKFYENITEYTKPIPEAIDFIKELKAKGIKIGVVTSDATKSAELTIKHYKWENLFDVVIGRESCPHTKESGEPTKLALSLLNATPDTTIMIGDAPMDFISAQNANIERTILVATGQINKTQLLNTSKYSVNSLNEIEICTT